jgi:hypothetical protein
LRCAQKPDATGGVGFDRDGSKPYNHHLRSTQEGHVQAAEFDKHVGILRNLVLTPGVSGWEDPVRAKIAELVAPYGDTEVDAMGNLILSFGKGDKHALFVAHMDEIGLVVATSKRAASSG